MRRYGYLAAGFAAGLLVGLLLAGGLAGYLYATKSFPFASLWSAPLAAYDAFDGLTFTAPLVAVPDRPEFVPGRFGNALCLRYDNLLPVKMPQNFLQAATVMAWVRIDNQHDRSIIWYHTMYFPGAYNHPDGYGLHMSFITTGPHQGLHLTLTQDMQPGIFHHLAQSWGPQGPRAYLNGVLVQSAGRLGKGPPLRDALPIGPVLCLGSIPRPPNYDGPPRFRANQEWIMIDDFAVFAGQLDDGEIAVIANSDSPLLP